MRLALLLAAVLLSACGAPTDGTYEGPWSATTNSGAGLVQSSGLARLTITGAKVDGLGGGSLHDGAFTVAGTMKPNGAAELTYTFPTQTYRALGTLAFDGERISGDLNLYVATVQHGTMRVDFSRQP